jgi:hypothetical protein
MAKNTSVIDKPPIYISMTKFEALQVFGLGLMVGFLVKVLGIAFSRFFIEPVFCRAGADTWGLCANGDLAGMHIATVVMVFVATVIMVRMNVFRPLLVAVASAATLWGFTGYTSGVTTYASVLEQTLWLMTLYGLTYVLYFWVLRLRNFAVSLIVIILLILGLRFLLIAG